MGRDEQTQRFHRSSAPRRLPPGRHGLPRSFVVADQRERIITAVAAASSVTGYGSMTIEDICSHAGVSRRTFYDHFDGKQDAFVAAFDVAIDQVLAQVRDAMLEHDGFVDRVHAAVRCFVDFIEAEPAFASLCVVEAPAAGQEGMEKRNRTLQRFADLIAAGVPEDGLPEDHPAVTPLTAMIVAGGLREVVYHRLVDGRVVELRELVPHLTYSILLPYLGRSAAEEYRRSVEATAAA